MYDNFSHHGKRSVVLRVCIASPKFTDQIAMSQSSYVMN